MAKIVHSDAAPAERVNYSFSGVEFSLGGSAAKSYESDDPSVISNAEAHPWLSVEREPVEVVSGEFVEQLRPEDDHLSAVNSVANDPEAARKAEQAKRDAADNPVAIEAGHEQTDAVETDGIAETLAADETSRTSDKKGSN